MAGFIVAVIVFAGVVAFAYISNARDDGSDAVAWAWLRRMADRGRTVAGARRTAFTQAIHLQRARATRNPDALAPAELHDLDRYGKPWLRKVAGAEEASLVAALAATQDDPDNPGRDRALACYDAAALLSTERDGRLDLFGVIVLAREGQTALADRDPLPQPVCQVHPWHGSALRRPRPGEHFRKLPALCAQCRRCSAAERRKRALLVDGVPYYLTAGFWTDTGFGALDPELPARVLEYLGVE